MAIVRPVVFTSIEDAEVTFTRPVSEETVRKMIQNANMLAALAAIGSVRCVALNQPSVTSPSPDQWQMSTGSEIVHPQSPLASVTPNNYYTPDFTNKYIRGADEEVEIENDVGGNYTVDLSHSHSTGSVVGYAYGEEGNEQKAYETLAHNHGVANDLSASEPLEPAHQQVAVYFKIN